MRSGRALGRTAPSALTAYALAVLVLVGEPMTATAGAGLRANEGAVVTTDELEVTVARAELRWSKTGRLLGHLNRGTPLERLGDRAGWIRVQVHGWIWSASLERRGDRYRLVPPEENLRSGPSGAIRGALVRGVEVRRVGGKGRWYEVELIGWLPQSAVRQEDAARTEARSESPATPEVEGADGSSTRGSAAPGDAGAGGITPEPERTESAPSAGPRSAPTPAGQLAERVALRGVPGGAAVATLPSGLVLTPLETRGGWTRVAVEGWVPSSAVRTGTDAASSPAAVAMSPESFAGRQVMWTLEHVALQKADRWRTDLEPGEWYALARVSPGGGRYVYLALPAGLVDDFRELSPFQTIRIEGQIRAGKSDLTGSPIVSVTRLLP